MINNSNVINLRYTYTLENKHIIFCRFIFINKNFNQILDIDNVKVL